MTKTEEQSWQEARRLEQEYARQVSDDRTDKALDISPSAVMASCAFCGVDYTHQIATCGTCGRSTCPDHRVNDHASRCNDCAVAFYTITREQIAELLSSPGAPFQLEE
jgi:hypothetical protein